jgi:hypothetical protein
VVCVFPESPDEVVGGPRVLPYQRLSQVFDRALRDGLESLSEEERDLYLIQDFIIEQEMNGLSGYFYNRLPDPAQISSTVSALRQYGLSDLAAILNEALQLFEGYRQSDSETTWSEILSRYDPEDRLETLAKKVNALDDYGLANSRIE